MTRHKDQELLDLSKAQRSMQGRGLHKLRELLLVLCKAHADIEFVPTLRALVIQSNWAAVLDYADVLTSQKYGDAELHFCAHQFASLIRKYPFPPSLAGTDPKGTALAKFFASEHRCKRINQRFAARRRVSRRAAPREYALHAMRKWIAYVLGDAPNMDVVYENCGFGPGASLGIHGNATNFARKILADSWTVTPGAYHLGFVSVLNHVHLRSLLAPSCNGFASGLGIAVERLTYDAKVTVVRHNNIQFVPKTARTFRSIATEPLLNGFLQKGIDILMRLCLKRIGIDLQKQEPNAEMALLGSLDDSEEGFVTIDLSAASDSVARELVRELLPPDWYVLLDRARSREFQLDGQVHTYHKFCSMGNGFCFPLETLIFAAACHAVGAGTPGKDFRVYGDDIVVRKKYAAPVIELLNYLGFKTNREKTFTEGPFRESCGKDYFNGVDVRPYILDEALESIESLYKILNSTNGNERWQRFFQSVRPVLLRWVPAQFRYFRPYPGEVDTGIDASNCDEYLTCPTCEFKRPLRKEDVVTVIGDTWRRRSTRLYGPATWVWKELSHVPVRDSGARRHDEYYLALMYGAMAGVSSHLPFTIRRQVDTKVVEKHHPGATSQWLPAQFVDRDLRAGFRDPALAFS